MPRHAQHSSRYSRSIPSRSIKNINISIPFTRSPEKEQLIIAADHVGAIFLYSTNGPITSIHCFFLYTFCVWVHRYYLSFGCRVFREQFLRWMGLFHCEQATDRSDRQLTCSGRRSYGRICHVRIELIAIFSNLNSVQLLQSCRSPINWLDLSI